MFDPIIRELFPHLQSIPLNQVLSSSHPELSENAFFPIPKKLLPTQSIVRITTGEIMICPTRFHIMAMLFSHQYSAVEIFSTCSYYVPQLLRKAIIQRETNFLLIFWHRHFLEKASCVMVRKNMNFILMIFF